MNKQGSAIPRDTGGEHAAYASLQLDDPVPAPPRCLQAMRDGRCYVYFIAGSGTPIKIGMSSAPYERLAALQTAHWSRLEILALMEGGLLLEAEMHQRFAALRLEGEWFARTLELERHIEQVREANGVPLPFYTPAINTRPRDRRLNKEQAA